MVSYSQSIKDINVVIESAKTWQVSYLGFTVANSLRDDCSKFINVIDTIGYGRQKLRLGHRTDKNCYFLQSAFNRNDEQFRQEKIYPDFIFQARDASKSLRPCCLKCFVTNNLILARVVSLISP